MKIAKTLMVMVLVLALSGLVSAFEITEPSAKSYNATLVPFEVENNATLDNISYKVDNGTLQVACTNCSNYSAILNLSKGRHTLLATGVLGNVTYNDAVNFSVKLPEIENEKRNETERPENKTTPRFTLGFEKLPKAVEEGNISDSELASIIRNNKINPGILNRLIKTGKLGNESLTTILDTQFRPQGLLRKILSLMGFKLETYASSIYEHYNLTPSLEKKIVARDDLPKKYAEKVQEKLREREQKNLEKENKEMEKEQERDREKNESKLNNSGKSLEIGKQNGKDDDFVAPGQAKEKGSGKGSDKGEGSSNENRNRSGSSDDSPDDESDNSGEED
ncbi:MAG: hypothetical protein V1702_00875 [Candidatus Woesearchaeota archaeon]